MSFDELLDPDAGPDAPEQRHAIPSTTGAQLRLLTPPAQHDWSLDVETRRRGKVGVAAARATLKRVTPPDGYESAA